MVIFGSPLRAVAYALLARRSSRPCERRQELDCGDVWARRLRSEAPLIFIESEGGIVMTLPEEVRFSYGFVGQRSLESVRRGERKSGGKQYGDRAQRRAHGQTEYRTEACQREDYWTSEGKRGRSPPRLDRFRED